MKLTQKVIFIFLLALGFARNCQAQTWTFVQSSLDTYCVKGNSSCSFSSGTLAPTTAGTVRVITLSTKNTSGAPPNVTITSVSGAGSTWQLCPASSCHFLGVTDDLDMAYAIGGSGGQVNITVNLSGASGSSSFSVHLYEFLPPAGSTASFDASGTTSNACSGGTVAGAALPVSATDAILQLKGDGSAASAFAWNAPYIQITGNNGMVLNDSTGKAPTINCSATATMMAFSAIAFKSTAGTFTPPAAHMKVANYTNTNTVQTSCSPSCTFTIASTGSGNLLYLQAANISGTFISSVSGAGTWVVPTGTNTCRASMGSDTLSCAYVLSTSPGVTSLNITMTGSGVTQFAVAEIAPNSGFSFVFDTQGSTNNTTASFNPPGQALSLSGSDDAIFQASFIPGGSTARTYYPIPPSTEFWHGQANLVMVLDAPYGAFPSNARPTWGNQQNNATLVTGAAFKTASGTVTAPNPPTGLTAVVN